MPVGLFITYKAKSNESTADRGETLKNKLQEVVGKKATAATYGKGERKLQFTFRSFEDARVPRVRVSQILKKAGHEYSTSVEGLATK